MVAYEQALINVLSSFDAAQFLAYWRPFIREVEELINYHYGLLKADADLVFQLALFSPQSNADLEVVVKLIALRYGKDAGDRFRRLYDRLFTVTVNKVLRNVLGDADYLPALRTMFDVLLFCQGIRLYLVTIEPLVIAHGTGKQLMDDDQLAETILPALNFYCRNITRGHHELLMNACYGDYEALYDGHILKTNRDYQQLEGFFLEPEVLSLQDQQEFRTGPVVPDTYPTVFSLAELQNNLDQMANAFERYKKRNPQIFPQLKDLITLLGTNINDDYWLEIDQEQLNELQITFPDLQFVTNHNQGLLNLYYDIAPLRIFHGRYFSTLPLLTRFIYRTITVTLKKGRSFQTNAGFVFEDKLKALLASLGFNDTKIKRIGRKEFDVVTTKNQTIYNFQCKNNFIDIARIHNDVKEMSKLNDRLVKRYIKALVKEEGREQVLLQKLGLSTIEHFVVSRFPLLTDHPHLINFNQLTDRLNAIDL
jgi:hypothetical protein